MNDFDTTVTVHHPIGHKFLSKQKVITKDDDVLILTPESS